MNTTTPPAWLDEPQAEVYLGIPKGGLYRIRRHSPGDAPPAYRIGPKVIRYRQTELDAWLETRRLNPLTPAA